MYKLRELEKLGSKAGIVEQTVKEVLQSLVDDNLVNQDKVGSINLFYSFPSAQMVRRMKQIDKLKEEETKLKEKKKALEENIEKLKKDRGGGEKRVADLEILNQLRTKKAKLTEESDTWKENDPSILKELGTKKNAIDRFRLSYNDDDRDHTQASSFRFSFVVFSYTQIRERARVQRTEQRRQRTRRIDGQITFGRSKVIWSRNATPIETPSRKFCKLTTNSITWSNNWSWWEVKIIKCL